MYTPPRNGSLRALLADLHDSPSESVVVAFAYALFHLEHDPDRSDRKERCFDEAEYFLSRLRESGFDIVRKSGAALHSTSVA